MKAFILFLISFLVFLFDIEAQKWSIAEAPLLTPWSTDVDPLNVLPEYPRPIMQRVEWMNLNGLWQFAEANEGEHPPFGKKLAGNILVPFPWGSALSGVRKQLKSRRAWYKRTFSVPEKWNTQRILLHFGAVDWEAKVYINKKAVGIHQGGFDAFYFDITEYLTTRDIQEIVIEVWDPGNDKAIAVGKQNNSRFDDPHGIAYSPSSGIWQTVWLEPVPKVYIKDLIIRSDIDKQKISVNVNLSDITNQSIEVVIKDNNQIVAAVEGSPNQEIIANIDNPKLWSPENPFLYDIEIILKDVSISLDKIKSYVGMRKISLSKEHGLQRIYLNNKSTFLMGTLDQGYWPDGIYTAPTDEALRWDIENTKEFGFNMIRKHIKVEPQRWYYWCDKLGIVVWQDMPHTFASRDEGDKTQFELELKNMVKTHWNHPSIVNWIIFNEHWGAYDAERLTEETMKLDPSRLVTSNTGIDSGRPDLDFEIGHIKSNHSYRPPNCPFGSSKRAIVCGEYGAIGYKIEGHIWDKDGPWIHDTYEDMEAATSEYENFINMIVNFQKQGLSAAVYTQWTDVENEMNGIYTYDRKLIKMNKERVTNANKSTYLYKTELETLNKRDFNRIIVFPSTE